MKKFSDFKDIIDHWTAEYCQEEFNDDMIQDFIDDLYEDLIDAYESENNNVITGEIFDDND